jgi:hypothetical protein
MLSGFVLIWRVFLRTLSGTIVPDKIRVINPAWRQLNNQIRRQNGLLSRKLLQFAEIHLP